MKLSPSFIAHCVNGLLILFSIILLYDNFDKVKEMSSSYFIMLVLLFAISIGVHGLSHLGLEYIYKYNPLDKT